MKLTARALLAEDDAAMLANNTDAERWLFVRARVEGAIVLPAIPRRPAWTWSTRGGDIEDATAEGLATRLGWTP